MLYTLPLAQLPQNSLFFLHEFGRDQDHDGLSDHLLGGVAERPFGPLIPTCDGAIERHTDNDIIAGFDDGRQIRLRHLRLLAPGDIDAHTDETRIAIELDPPTGEVIGNLSAAFGNKVRLGRRCSVHKHLPDPLNDHLLLSFAEEVQGRHFRDLLSRVLADLFKRVIPAEKLTAVVDEVKDAGQAIDNQVAEPLLYREPFFGLLAIGDVDNRGYESGHLAHFVELRLVDAPNVVSADFPVSQLHLELAALAAQRRIYIRFNGDVSLFAEHVTNRPANEVLLAQAEPLGVGLVHEFIGPVGPNVRDQDRRAIRDQTQKPLALPGGL